MADIPENTLIKVEWDDTFLPTGHGAWWDREEIEPRCELEQENVIVSIGFLIWSNERFIAMAHAMWSEDSQVSGLDYIPQGCIRRVTVLSTDGEIVFDCDSQEEE